MTVSFVCVKELWRSEQGPATYLHDNFFLNIYFNGFDWIGIVHFIVMTDAAALWLQNVAKTP